MARLGAGKLDSDWFILSDLKQIRIKADFLSFMHFLVDHSSDYATVFFTSAACALALAVIVGVYVLYCHRESKQHLHTAGDSKLRAYEINDSKAPEQVDRFILGPVKTAPPDYMLHEYDWKSEESKGSQNNLQNGSVVKNFNNPELVANAMNGQSRLVNPSMLQKKFFNCCKCN